MTNNDHGPGSKPTPDPVKTREWLLWPRAAGYTQVRHLLVQNPERSGPRPALLGKMVNERRHRELLLYLLLLGALPRVELLYDDDKAPLGARVWMRGLEARPSQISFTASTMSRCWKRLEELDLVSAERKARRKRVVPRREDGKEDYTNPDGTDSPSELYFVLPHEFWTKDVFAKLTLPELAVFLIVLKETGKKAELGITLEQTEKWYGISRRSAFNGFTRLEKRGLLNVRREWEDAPDTDEGLTQRHYYSLTGDFSTDARKELRRKAEKAGSERRAAREAAEEGQGVQG